jgi:hypothetical protein
MYEFMLQWYLYLRKESKAKMGFCLFYFTNVTAVFPLKKAFTGNKINFHTF